ncbi:LacI family transcriptional regulator [Paenibacillus hemerocallicola]|uniref:LacI family transcriptional regulator n=1 Tax=Paenibacillus hemerocallicola TaxID=1172614 RepID=A0A5C4TFF2_9BACL|nr:LacI family DNA-binding transcriptional regulator [Paenibacillus hemerocallicola]TNJ67139.1 LacI family transcriptional regulator [Paenibacillus hemerocallicola]
MTVTIKDIARMAGVSHTTVSRALNDSPLIHEDTKRKIRAIAARLDYTPNYSAKSLVLARSYHIGLFFSTLSKGTSSNFFHETVKGVHSTVNSKYHLIVNAIDDYDGNFATVTRKTFDGVIVMSQSDNDESFIRYVADRSIPLVVLNRNAEHLSPVHVLADDRAGVYRVVEHMIMQGHNRIAIIEGKQSFKSSQARKDGYLQALRQYGIGTDDKLHTVGGYTLEGGYRAMKELLRLTPLPTAVFCSSDEMAVGAMKAIADSGLSVPGDISVAGFDDDIFSAFLSPALTTVKRPVETISRIGAEKLLREIERGSPSKETLFVETELVVRESVRQIGRA